MPALLVFDTSGERLSAGLVTETGRWVHDAAGGAQASSALLPALHHLLASAGIGMRDLDAIGFGQGPGAFTGLRTACAVAQGLAAAIGRPLLPIDTLEAVAVDAWLRCADRPDRPVHVWAVQDARMDEVYAAAYRIDPDGSSRTLQGAALWTPEALRDAWAGPSAQVDGPTLVAGSAVAAFGERLHHPSARHEARAWPSGEALIALARRGHAEGAGVAPADARPVYVRDRVALTTAERAEQAARAERRPAQRTAP
jgi:tRNA threonylcarbamoyladenosine biosynthesis protein TsaB